MNQLTAEEKKALRKEYARRWYEANKAPKKQPVSYDLEYRQQYHKEYYKKNREKLLQHQKELNAQYKNLHTQVDLATNDAVRG